MQFATVLCAATILNPQMHDDLTLGWFAVQSLEEELVSAINDLQIKKPGLGSSVPLRGVAVPQGTHTRFDDDGKPVDKVQRTLLRGIPAAHGSHTRFD